MNGNQYLEIKNLRSEYDGEFESGAEYITLTKENAILLFNAALGRSYQDSEFRAKLIKITPKERRDNDVLELTFSAEFTPELTADVSRFFGKPMSVYIEPVPQEVEPEGDDDDGEYSPAHDDPNQMIIPLDGEEESEAEEAETPADPLTGYVGDDAAEMPTF